MGAQENEATIRRWVESLNRGAPALEETFAPDAAITLVGQPQVRDPQSFLAFLGVLGSAFPGMQFEVHDLTATDEVVSGRWVARGTHGGEFLGTPATGRAVAFEGCVIDHYRDGKIVRRWELVDTLGMLQQIGAVPTPGAAA